MIFACGQYYKQKSDFLGSLENAITVIKDDKIVPIKCSSLLTTPEPTGLSMQKRSEDTCHPQSPAGAAPAQLLGLLAYGTSHPILFNKVWWKSSQ